MRPEGKVGKVGDSFSLIWLLYRSRKKKDAAGPPEKNLIAPAFRPAVKIKTEPQEEEATEAPKPPSNAPRCTLKNVCLL